MSTRSIGQLTVDLIAKTFGFEQGMDKAAKTADKRMKEIEASAKKAGAFIGTAIGAGVVAAGAALTKLTVDAINYADALDEMTNNSEDGRVPIAPVDLSQAVIGPGMAIFSKYQAVLEADGTPMSVRTALQLINRFLAEDDFDADTQFCLRWFEQCRWSDGRFGDAETLSRAKGTSVEGVKAALGPGLRFQDRPALPQLPHIDEILG